MSPRSRSTPWRRRDFLSLAAGPFLAGSGLSLAGGTTTSERKKGLSVGSDGALLRDGRPWRGAGVNFFDAFYRLLLDPKDDSHERGFAELADHGIPFARTMGCGYWPSELRLYLDDREAYLSRLDRVVKSARRHGVGLIPSLFWNVAAVPDLVKEPVGEWGNPNSRTRAFMSRYVKDVVGRYARSPAIWGWEFGNEFNLGADLPNASEHRPPVVPDRGTPTSRSERDEWSYKTIRSAFRAFGEEVRRYDARGILSTGDGFLRPSAWHNRKERNWTVDSPSQFEETVRFVNPDPINVVSVHVYDDDVKRIERAAKVASRMKKPLFAGEFGVPGPPTEENERRFAAMLDALERAKVPLAALWVYGYRDQDDFSVTATNARSYQLKALRDWNRRAAQELK